MSKVLTPGLRNGQFLLTPATKTRSLDNLIIKAGVKVQPGQVMAIETSSGKVVPLNTAGTGGADVAKVLPLYAYDATDEDVMGAFVTRDAELIGPELIWPEGMSGSDRLAAIEELKAEGLIVRPESYV